MDAQITVVLISSIGSTMRLVQIQRKSRLLPQMYGNPDADHQNCHPHYPSSYRTASLIHMPAPRSHSNGTLSKQE